MNIGVTPLLHLDEIANEAGASDYGQTHTIALDYNLALTKVGDAEPSAELRSLVSVHKNIIDLGGDHRNGMTEFLWSGLSWGADDSFELASAGA